MHTIPSILNAIRLCMCILCNKIEFKFFDNNWQLTENYIIRFVQWISVSNVKKNGKIERKNLIKLRTKCESDILSNLTIFRSDFMELFGLSGSIFSHHFLCAVFKIITKSTHQLHV